MPISKTLIFITANPHSHQAKLALQQAKNRLVNGESVAVFFYGDGAYTANRLMWQTADVPNIAAQWVWLAEQYGIRLPVCVSTALARGVTDQKNAERHKLEGDNLMTPFALVGLSELVLMIADDVQVLQY